MKPPEVYYDEEDPEVSEAVLQRSLEFDASTVDYAVIPRRDHAPRMGADIARHRKVRGLRMIQADPGLMASHGMGLPECRHQIECSVEKSKEVPSRLRPDIGTTFDQVRGRQPRLAACPVAHPRQNMEFLRTAPAGFNMRASVGRPMVDARTRSYDALPDWSPVDEEVPIPG